MVELWTDRATGTLSAGISAGDVSLSLSSGQGSLFPSPSSPDYFWATLEEGPLFVPTKYEVIKCTARSGDSFGTITRGEQGTTAQSFSAGARVQLRTTRDTLVTARDRLIEMSLGARFIPQTGFMGANNAQTGDPWGLFNTGAVTSLAPALASTNQVTGQFRAQIASTTIATAQRGIDRDIVFRGDAAGLGGFHFEGKCSLGANNNTTRMFIGLTDSTGAALISTINPSASTGHIFGIGFDDGLATGNLRFFHGSGSTTDDDTGISRASMLTNLVYWLIHADANASSIRLVVRDLVTGTGLDQDVTASLPSATVGLVLQQSIKGNGGGNSGLLDISYAGGWAYARPFPW